MKQFLIYLNIFLVTSLYAADHSCTVYYRGKLTSIPTIQTSLVLIKDFSYWIEEIDVQNSEECLALAKERHSKKVGAKDLDIAVAWDGGTEAGPAIVHHKMRTVNAIEIKFISATEEMSSTLKP